jgi:hypothetical protein
MTGEWNVLAGWNLMFYSTSELFVLSTVIKSDAALRNVWKLVYKSSLLRDVLLNVFQLIFVVAYFQTTYSIILQYLRATRKGSYWQFQISVPN